MAEITEIIAKEAIKDIEAADKALTAFDDGIMQVITHLGQLNQATGKGGIKEYNQALKEQNQVQKEAIKATKDRERAEAKAAQAEAKAAEKVRQHNEALALNVKTVDEAKRQLKALTIERDKASTSMGKQSQAVKDLNAKMQQNTEFIRANGTAAEKQRMNIGNYASALNGVKGAAIAVMGALGITAGLAGVLKVVQGAIATSNAAADELERTMGGMKEQANYFGRALMTLDFSKFRSNLKAANDEGRRYISTLQDIEDLKLSLALQKDDIELQIIQQRTIAKDRRNDLKDREAAVEEIIRLEEQKLTKTLEVSQLDLDNYLQNTEFKTKADRALLMDMIKNSGDYINQIKKGAALVRKINKETQTEMVTQYGIQIIVDTKAREKAFASLNEEQKKQVLYYKTDAKLLGKQREEITKLAQVNNAATREMAEGKESLVRLQNRLYNELIKEEEATEKAATATVKQQTTVEQLTGRISALKKELENSLLVTGTAPEGLVRELIGSEGELERVKNQMDEILARYQQIVNIDIPESPEWMPEEILTPDSAGPKPAEEYISKGINWSREDTLAATETVTDAAMTMIRNADQAAFDNKMMLLEKEKEAKLSNTKLTEKQRAKIEEDYRKKEAKLKEQQFRKQKAADIIQSIINTALGVTKASPNVAQMILAGIAGAAQTAIIAAQPIPKFDKGTMRTPSVFIAGENRPEWMISPSGAVSLVTRPTMFKNMAGATVIGGEETERMMKAGIAPTSDMRPDIRAMKSEIVRAIRDKRELHITGSGSRITERAGNYYKEYYNRQVQWAGRKN